MRFVTFRRPSGAPEPGVVLDQKVVGLAGAGFPDVLSIVSGAEEARDRIDSWIAAPPAEAVADLDTVTLMAPIPRPPKIICVGLNWVDHAMESGQEIPEVPTIFSKFPTSVIGPGDKIVLPRSSAKPDYEAEFAFVIGKGGRYIPAFRWREHVFGYMNFNDVSARDYQTATSQWMIGKSFDNFAPMGPYLVSADEIPDPHDLDIMLTINGEVLQHSNTRHLIFRIPDLISFLSSVSRSSPATLSPPALPPASVLRASRPASCEPVTMSSCACRV